MVSRCILWLMWVIAESHPCVCFTLCPLFQQAVNIGNSFKLLPLILSAIRLHEREEMTHACRDWLVRAEGCTPLCCVARRCSWWCGSLSLRTHVLKVLILMWCDIVTQYLSISVWLFIMGFGIVECLLGTECNWAKYQFSCWENPINDSNEYSSIRDSEGCHFFTVFPP